MDLVQIIYEQTAVIAGRYVQHASPTPDYAAKQAKLVMAALLGVDGIEFKLSKDHRDNLQLELTVTDK